MTFLNKWIVAKRRHLDQLVDRSGVLPYYIRRKPFNGVLETEYGDTFNEEACNYNYTILKANLGISTHHIIIRRSSRWYACILLTTQTL